LFNIDKQRIPLAQSFKDIEGALAKKCKAEIGYTVILVSFDISQLNLNAISTAHDEV
jgi:hypothetical protein